MPYSGFSDTPEHVRDKVIPAIKIALSKAKSGFITPGTRNCFLYPPPDDMGVWFNPAGTSIGNSVEPHFILREEPQKHQKERR
jgi:hypothetical protein